MSVRGEFKRVLAEWIAQLRAIDTEASRTWIRKLETAGRNADDGGITSEEDGSPIVDEGANGATGARSAAGGAVEDSKMDGQAGGGAHG